MIVGFSRNSILYYCPNPHALCGKIAPGATTRGRETHVGPLVGSLARGERVAVGKWWYTIKSMGDLQDPKMEVR